MAIGDAGIGPVSHGGMRRACPSQQPLEPTDCGGALSLVAAVFDRCDGHLVETYRCPDCGRTIALDAHERVVRNDYPS